MPWMLLVLTAVFTQPHMLLWGVQAERCISKHLAKFTYSVSSQIFHDSDLQMDARLAVAVWDHFPVAWADIKVIQPNY